MRSLFYRVAIATTIIVTTTQALPTRHCPGWFRFSGHVNDMGLLADAVSWDDNSQDVAGQCAAYRVVQEVEGLYDTRMRIYQTVNGTDVFIVFRPTQQTPEGQKIHDNRQLVGCDFVPGGCVGRVHERFQQAFKSLFKSKDTTVKPYVTNNLKVYLVGHSLGGALTIFAAVYLWHTYGVLATINLGFAGPFIGDERFTNHHIQPLRMLYGSSWWQIETVDSNKPNTNYDGTVETYNIGNNEKNNNIFIEDDLVCGLYIDPLPIPSESYGMHDLKQYRTVLKGEDCYY